MGLLVMLLLILLLAWLYREYSGARRQTTESYAPPPPKPLPPRHQRVSDEELARQVDALKGAMAEGIVTEDEAIASLVRTAGLEPDAARVRLRR